MIDSMQYCRRVVRNRRAIIGGTSKRIVEQVIWRLGFGVLSGEGNYPGIFSPRFGCSVVRRYGRVAPRNTGQVDSVIKVNL